MKTRERILMDQDKKEDEDSGDGFPAKMVLFIVLLSVALMILILFKD